MTQAAIPKGPPIFLEALYWEFQNQQYGEEVLSNYEGLLRGIRNLSNYEPKVKALYFPFLIQWSIDNQSAGAIYPAVLSDTLPAEQVPYALRKDIKFTVTYQNSSQLGPTIRKPFKVLTPSTTGGYIHYSTMDLLDPIGSLKDNTIIVAPGPNAKVGTEFTLTIYVTHTILNEVKAKYVIRFKVGDEFWTYPQGSEFTKETISNLMSGGAEISVGHTCLSYQYGSCTENKDSFRKFTTYYNYGASPPYYKLQMTYYYQSVPRVNVKVLGYGPYGEAIIEVSLYAKLNNVFLLEDKYHYFYSGVGTCGEPFVVYTASSGQFSGTLPSGGEDLIHISDSIESGRIYYSTSVKAVLIAGGALPIGTTLIPPLGQEGSWQAGAYYIHEEHSLRFVDGCGINCVGETVYTQIVNGTPCETVKWTCTPFETFSMSDYVGRATVNSQITGINIFLEPVPSAFRHLSSNSSDLDIVFVPEGEGWGTHYSRSFSSPGGQLEEVSWREPYMAEYFSEFSQYVYPLRYRPSGRAEDIDILKESYVGLSVSNFYAAPGDEVSGSVEVVYGGEGVETEVDIEILV